MVVEGRRDEPRTDVQPAEQVALDDRPGVLAARHEPLVDRHLARPDAWSPVDLALAPAALPRVAHQTPWSMEAEAPRQDGAIRRQHGDRERFVVEPLVRRAVEGEADPTPWGVRRRARESRQATCRHVSGCGRSGCCRCRRASTRGTRPAPPCRARDRCRCPSRHRTGSRPGGRSGCSPRHRRRAGVEPT